MPQGTVRRFSVHDRHIDHHHTRLVDEASIEAAAVAYVEDFHPPVSDSSEIRVIVREVGTTHEHCFTISLDTGATSPCN